MCWWEEVTGASPSLSAEYLCDLSTPWTAEAFKHVFAPHDTAPATRANTNLSQQERLEIILDISKTFKAVSPASTLRQPSVSFVGQQVHLASLDEALLHAFWKSPPMLKGHAMKFISRGLPFSNIKTYYAVNIPAMPRDELIRKISGTDQDNIKLVLASLYQVKGIPGSPMFGGDVYVYRERSYHCTFLGKGLTEVRYE